MNGNLILTVRDFILPAHIGIYPHEQDNPQPIRVNIEMALDGDVTEDRIEDTVSYEIVVGEIRRLAGIHHNLVEIFAKNLADFTLGEKRVRSVTVHVEKLEIFPEGSVGCKITRARA